MQLVTRLTQQLILTPVIIFLLCSHALALDSDLSQMIDIQADSAFHDEKNGLTIYQGNVSLQQGTLKIKAQKITINTNKDGDISILTAQGKPAKFEQKPSLDQEIVYGRANLISYELLKEKISLQGNAHIKQGQAELNSDSITYLANQQVFKANRDKALKDKKPKRVHMIIPPKKKRTEDK